MRNPFEYGGIVLNEAFCNRTREREEIRRVIENAGKLFVYAERRIGKTSLVQQVLRELPEDDYVKIYIDLWPTDGPASFVATVAKGITEALASRADRLLETAKRLFSRLIPSVTVDEEGKPVIAFGIRDVTVASPVLEEVLQAPARLAEEGRRKVVVVLDEFQQILEYGTDEVERRLRSIIQHHQEVAYLFLGSRKHLIQQMFLDRNRPLYRSAAHYPLEAIGEEEWRPFIQERFRWGRRTISDEAVHEVCDLTQGHPFYTQHLCHVLWERCEEGGVVDAPLIAGSVEVLLRRESYAYTALWESLTINQRRFLKGLAAEAAGVQPFASAFIQRYRLKSPSNAQRAAKALLSRDLIDRDNGSYLVQDRFFRLWIQQMQAS